MTKRTPYSYAQSSGPTFEGTVTIRAVTDIPARLVGGNAQTVVVDGLDYRLNLDISKLPQAPPGVSVGKFTVVWDSVDNTYKRVEFTELPAAYTNWDSLLGKPATYPPTLPIPQSGVAGLDLALDDKTEEAPTNGITYGRMNGTWVDVASAVDTTVIWDEIQGKPTTYPPSTHTHTVSQLADASTIGRTLMQAPTAPSARAAIAAISTDDLARHTVQRAGVTIGARRAINLIDAGGITSTVIDDAANERINITLTSLGGSSGGGGITDAPIDGNTYGRKDAAWVQIASLTVNWGDITGKPSTFPPDPHTHPIADVTGLQAALNGKPPEAPADGKIYGRQNTAWADLATNLHVTWANIDNRPSTFPPSVHTHVVADVSGLQTALDGKQPLDADLTAIAGLGTIADRVPYATGVSTWALATLTPAARNLLDDPDTAAMLTTLGAASAASLATYAPLASPLFTGNPRVPSPAAADSSDSAPNTAWVQNLVAAMGGAIQRIGVMSPNGVAVADFTNWPTGYTHLMVIGEVVLSAAGFVGLRVSLDGSAFEGGATDYRYQTIYSDEATTTVTGSGNSGQATWFLGWHSNNAAFPSSFVTVLPNAHGTVYHKRQATLFAGTPPTANSALSRTTITTGSTNFVEARTAPLRGLRFMPNNAGTLSGLLTLYGIK